MKGKTNSSVYTNMFLDEIPFPNCVSAWDLENDIFKMQLTTSCRYERTQLSSFDPGIALQH